MTVTRRIGVKRALPDYATKAFETVNFQHLYRKVVLSTEASSPNPPASVSPVTEKAVISHYNKVDTASKKPAYRHYLLTGSLLRQSVVTCRDSELSGSRCSARVTCYYHAKNYSQDKRQEMVGEMIDNLMFECQILMLRLLAALMDLGVLAFQTGASRGIFGGTKEPVGVYGLMGIRIREGTESSKFRKSEPQRVLGLIRIPLIRAFVGSTLPPIHLPSMPLLKLTESYTRGWPTAAGVMDVVVLRLLLTPPRIGYICDILHTYQVNQ
ncbi:uncharacterized protein BJ212DRAFT_1303316 [Suillus subaureus]|uniref:Uncharacterized protein n=1 Tax=Suillus subaureus TaxID=48587 RepID=A0A9P7J8G2_9AGAM|nr:uncharacterized protein BJ212DRAFT_1303316 [Suillus subaureus]KAG1807864.1 hypothetical protein BJ212DRAFT_1303316 [Suillus subaureus]